MRILLLCLLLAPSLACAEPVAMHPALWKVTRDHTVIWLFGTIHMLPPDADWLNGPVAGAADSADELATEIDDPDSTRTLAALSARGFLPEGVRLSAVIPADERSALVERLARFGMTLQNIDPHKPWFAAVELSMLPILRRGFAARDGVEMRLQAREAARHVRRVGIETPDEQLGLLDNLPKATQLAYLKSVIDDFDTIDAQISAMIAAWGNGDADGLARLMIEDEGRDDPLLIDRLITQRNQHFAAWISDRLKRPGSVFMAIGAGHLAGPGSVQDDLAKAGIVVERVQ